MAILGTCVVVVVVLQVFKGRQLSDFLVAFFVLQACSEKGLTLTRKNLLPMEIILFFKSRPIPTREIKHFERVTSLAVFNFPLRRFFIFHTVPHHTF